MAKRSRTSEFGIDFTGPNLTAKGWVFPVPQSFRERLDILWTKSKGHATGGWTQGVPARYRFQAGDVFYDPPEVRSMRWGDALLVLRRTVIVVEAIPDTITDVETEEGIAGGEVTFRLCQGQNFDKENAEKIRTTQRGFVDFLRTGERPSEIVEPRRQEQAVSYENFQHTHDGIGFPVGLNAPEPMTEIVVNMADGSRQRLMPTGLVRPNGGRLVWLHGASGKRVPLAWVTEVIDADGEVHQVSAWLQSVGWNFPERPGKPGEWLKEEVKRGLRVLLVLAMEGQRTLSEESIEVLRDYVRKRASMVGLPMSNEAMEAIKMMIPRMRPTYEIACHALRKQGRIDGHKWIEHHSLLMQCANRLSGLVGIGPVVQTLLNDITEALEVKRDEEDILEIAIEY